MADFYKTSVNVMQEVSSYLANYFALQRGKKVRSFLVHHMHKRPLPRPQRWFLDKARAYPSSLLKKFIRVNTDRDTQCRCGGWEEWEEWGVGGVGSGRNVEWGVTSICTK